LSKFSLRKSANTGGAKNIYMKAVKLARLSKRSFRF
jgi:hypothetical protein